MRIHLEMTGVLSYICEMQLLLSIRLTALSAAVCGLADLENVSTHRRGIALDRQFLVDRLRIVSANELLDDIDNAALGAGFIVRAMP